MTYITETSWGKIYAEQISQTSNSAKFKVTVYHNGGGYWGGRDMFYVNAGFATFHWAYPGIGYGGYQYSGGGYWYNGVELAYEYYSDRWDYICAWEWTRESPEISIDRGNARQGSKTFSLGLYNNQGWGDAWGSFTIYTTKIADVSNAQFDISIDGGDVSNRKIHVTASYTNPERYYTARITGPNYDSGDFGNNSTQASFSQDIDITYDMYETNQTYTLIIKGKDGNIYKNTSVTKYIEPSGVGIWRKENDDPNECYHMYYKNNNGDIIEVQEAWYRRNNRNIKTVK